jgi:regulator of cell morphogenesis and NO signaling
MPIDMTATVREIVRENPRAARVFESFGINHWSSGERSLEEVCTIGNLSMIVLQEQLAEALGQPRRIAESRWLTCALGELIDYIAGKHAYTKTEISRLEALADKVCSRHHLSHPELYRVRESIQLLGDELLPHMLSEEKLLAHLKAMELAVSDSSPMPAASFGSILAPVRTFEAEHEEIDKILKRLRMHAKNYVIPEAVCVSFKALYHGLNGLEPDIRQHIHFENGILFPRALELEKAA